MGNLSEHFSLVEFERSNVASSRGIRNVAPVNAQMNLKALCRNVLEPLRTWWGKPINIGSGYRCMALNKAVGGVNNSQHMTGEACDLCIDGDIKKGEAWVKFIRDNVEFDQCILEHNKKGSYWVHVSYKRGGVNRKQVIWNLLKK